MNSKSLILNVCLALCLAGPVLSQQPASTKRQAEIISVLKAKHRAFEEHEKVFQGRNRVISRINWQKYVKALQAVDVAGCPEDFRLDWKEYVDSCYQTETAGLRALAEIWNAARGDLKVSKEAPAGSPSVIWKKLCHRASVYHVSVPSDPY